MQSVEVVEIVCRILTNEKKVVLMFLPNVTDTVGMYCKK